MLMMKDNEIFMSKGDDVAFSISLTGVDGKPYTLQAGDKIIFSVSCGLKIETGYGGTQHATINITSADTASIAPGDYKYDITYRANTTNAIQHLTLPQPFHLMEVVE